MNNLENDLQAYRKGDAIQMTPDQRLTLASRHRVDPIAVTIAVNTLQDSLRLDSARVGARRLLGLPERKK